MNCLASAGRYFAKWRSNQVMLKQQASNNHNASRKLDLSHLSQLCLVSEGSLGISAKPNRYRVDFSQTKKSQIPALQIPCISLKALLKFLLRLFLAPLHNQRNTTAPTAYNSTSCTTFPKLLSLLVFNQTSSRFFFSIPIFTGSKSSTSFSRLLRQALRKPCQSLSKCHDHNYSCPT
jgi:hypothetical protein